MSDGVDDRLQFGDDCPVCGKLVKAVVESRGDDGPRVYNGECSQHARDGGSRYIFHQPDDDGMRFSAHEYGALLALMMTSDPWPTRQTDRDRVERLLNVEARERGYKDWTHAYHALREGGE